jgi:hypothetical protein
MAEAVRELEPPYAPDDVVAWFAEHYPRVSPTTVILHIRGLTVNDPQRRYHSRLARMRPLLWRRTDGSLEPFDPEVQTIEEVGMSAAEAADEAEPGLDTATAAEFYLEAHLEEFLLTNWNRIGWGRRLSIWHGEDGKDGHQLSTPIGRLDFLCVDQDTNALVVVELKRGLPADHAVGQVARYLGWVRSNLAAPGQLVEAIIVAHDADQSLRYAVSAVSGLSLLRYEVSFALHPIDGPQAI